MKTTMPERLETFLDWQAALPFRWGVSDCALFAADWVAMVSGQDPAEGIRGSYRSQEDAADVVGRLGGWQSIGDRSGWPMRRHGDVPGLGDVVLLSAHGGGLRTQRLGVQGASGWLVKPQGGGWAVVTSKRLALLAAWEAPCLRP